MSIPSVHLSLHFDFRVTFHLILNLPEFRHVPKLTQARTLEERRSKQLEDLDRVDRSHGGKGIG